MPITPKQSYVLQNLDRVEKIPYKVTRRTQRVRYQLDGWECTSQITALAVRDCVTLRHGGRLERRSQSAGSS